jgi:hypothetical protein
MDYQLVPSWQEGRWRVEVDGRLAGYVRRLRSWTGRSARWEALSPNLLPIDGRPASRTRREAAERCVATIANAERRHV